MRERHILRVSFFNPPKETHLVDVHANNSIAIQLCTHFQAYNIYKFLRKAIMDEYERNTQQLIESNKRYYDSPEECEWLKQRLFVNPSDSILGTE